jgi:hypothetical protein
LPLITTPFTPDTMIVYLPYTHTRCPAVVLAFSMVSHHYHSSSLNPR